MAQIKNQVIVGLETSLQTQLALAEEIASKIAELEAEKSRVTQEVDEKIAEYEQQLAQVDNDINELNEAIGILISSMPKVEEDDTPPPE